MGEDACLHHAPISPGLSLLLVLVISPHHTRCCEEVSARSHLIAQERLRDLGGGSAWKRGG